ncbi:hypothetical protein C8Q75DRAFT_790577 [Abortiporus biennis]|nr:hypothetical protein C8Q75DRAFT_790577 [Abortiporus biennis]
MTPVHSISYSGMPTMHMYPFPPGLMPPQAPRTKRRQVKNACTNCQKACKKCDDARPCLRCVKYGIAEECVDSQRKERQKGIKRGPYKKRDGKSANVDQQIDVTVQSGIPIQPATVAATSATPPMPYSVAPYPPPGYFGQYPPPTNGKMGETQLVPIMLPYYPPMYQGAHNGQEGEANGYQPAFYPAYVPYQYPPYVVPAPRPDGQQVPTMPPPPPHYAPYPQPYVPKQPTSRDIASDMNGQMMDPNARRDMRMDNGRMGDVMPGGGHGKNA